MAEKYDIEKYNRRLKKFFDDDEDRYYHTQGVRYTAAAMAMAHGEDYQKAELAGLLHDSAKNIPDPKKIKLCEKNDIPITPVERENVYLLHAKLGAYIARKKYKVEDEDVLNAITYHTTGRPAMSRLEQIIFIADYIEPRRFKAPDLPEVRKVAFHDLDECCYIILRDSVKYLRSKGGRIDEMTEKAFCYYEKLHMEKNGENS